jgi:hypothetical protein
LLAVVGGFVASLGMFAAGLAAAIYMLAVEPMGQPGPSVEVADLWTAEPRKIDRAAQHLERIPAQAPAGADQPAEPQIAAAAAAPAADFGSVDATKTASVQTATDDGRQDRLLPPPDELAGEDAQQPAVLDQLTAAHMDWCASRYRSYRPDDNSYTSFSGQQQPCVSPYTSDLTQEAKAEPALGAPPDRSIEPEFVDNELVDNELVDNSGSYPAFADEASGVQYAVDDTAAYAGSDHASYCFSRYRSYRPEDNTYQPFGGGPRQQCR